MLLKGRTREGAVGTRATVVEVLPARLPDGRMHIAVEGGERFRVLEVHTTARSSRARPSPSKTRTIRPQGDVEKGARAPRPPPADVGSSRAAARGLAAARLRDRLARGLRRRREAGADRADLAATTRYERLVELLEHALEASRPSARMKPPAATARSLAVSAAIAPGRTPSELFRHQDGVDEAPVRQAIVAGAVALADVAELLVEGDRGLVVREDVQLELADTRVRPSRRRRRAAPRRYRGAGGGGDRQAEVGDVRRSTDAGRAPARAGRRSRRRARRRAAPRRGGAAPANVAPLGGDAAQVASLSNQPSARRRRRAGARPAPGRRRARGRDGCGPSMRRRRRPRHHGAGRLRPRATRPPRPPTPAAPPK